MHCLALGLRGCALLALLPSLAAGLLALAVLWQDLFHSIADESIVCSNAYIGIILYEYGLSCLGTQLSARFYVLLVCYASS